MHLGPICDAMRVSTHSSDRLWMNGGPQKKEVDSKA